MDDNLPSINEAEELLKWAHSKNPGPWLEHSKTVARSAKTIAEKCDLDGEKAYTLGLLHDIGRYEGITGLKHTLAGYRLMKEKGYGLNAKICLTHSFPAKLFRDSIIKNDCTKEEMKIIETLINEFIYDDYDKLIQLCDAISTSEAVCIMEIRLVDVVRRYNQFGSEMLKKWNAFFEIKDYFDKRCQINIYELFNDEVVKKSVG